MRSPAWAFRFRGRDLDIREIGRQLNVETLLEGNVRRSGKRLRITAQLLNVADGYHLWSQRYDRELQDVFAIQDEITESIVKTLRPTLLGNQQAAARRHTENLDAFELYLKGRYVWAHRTQGPLVRALNITKKPSPSIPITRSPTRASQILWPCCAGTDTYGRER
jgi:hypothetical protein